MEERLVVRRGWLQGVKQGDKLKVRGRVYRAEEVASGTTTYQFSGVTTTYYVKKVIDEILSPLLRGIRCQISWMVLKLDLRKERDSTDHPLAKYARNVERYRAFNKRALPQKVRVLRVGDLQERKKRASNI